MTERDILAFLKSPNPLSDEAFLFLLRYREEDPLVDFKESFVDNAKHWLDLTKDVMAYATPVGVIYASALKIRHTTFLELRK